MEKNTSQCAGIESDGIAKATERLYELSSACHFAENSVNALIKSFEKLKDTLSSSRLG